MLAEQKMRDEEMLRRAEEERNREMMMFEREFSFACDDSDTMSQHDDLKKTEGESEEKLKNTQEEENKENKDNKEEQEEEKQMNAALTAEIEKEKKIYSQIRSEEFWKPKYPEGNSSPINNNNETSSTSLPTVEEQKIKNLLSQNFLEQPEIKKVEETSSLFPVDEYEGLSSLFNDKSDEKRDVLKIQSADRAKPWLSRKSSVKPV